MREIPLVRHAQRACLPRGVEAGARDRDRRRRRAARARAQRRARAHGAGVRGLGARGAAARRARGARPAAALPSGVARHGHVGALARPWPRDTRGWQRAGRRNPARTRPPAARRGDLRRDLRTRGSWRPAPRGPARRRYLPERRDPPAARLECGELREARLARPRRSGPRADGHARREHRADLRHARAQPRCAGGRVLRLDAAPEPGAARHIALGSRPRTARSRTSSMRVRTAAHSERPRSRTRSRRIRPSSGPPRAGAPAGGGGRAGL